MEKYLLIKNIVYLLFILILVACQNIPPVFQSASQSKASSVELPAEKVIEKTEIKENTETDVAPVIPKPEPVVPVAPEDLWLRFQKGLQLEYTDQRNVQQHIDWYLKNRYILERSQARIAYYLFFIMDELEKQGVPYDVALIPLIESQYNPFASSGLPAGMWQFMPATGRRFNLISNYWYDGRKDPVESTKAVATYFRYLMNYFDNDLLLALAAYNSGEGTVQNAINRNRRAGKPVDYWHLNLPSVTTSYIPKMLALAEIYKHPEKYNLTLHPITDKPYFTTIKVDSDIGLDQISSALRIPNEVINYLNAGIRKNARPGLERYAVNIPADKIDNVWNELEKIPQKSTTYFTEKKHLIKNGENLGGIASKYSVTVQQLKQWNNLRSDIIVAGKILHIAQPSTTLHTSTHRVKKPLTNGVFQHRVKSGESLWKIAQTYKVKIDSLAKWNNKSAKSSLKPGEMLVIYTNAKH